VPSHASSRVNPLFNIPSEPSGSYASSIYLFLKNMIVPSLIIPSLLRFIPLQYPSDYHGVGSNWGWTSVILPMSLLSMTLFPTFLVSAIMGPVSSSARTGIWRFTSMTTSTLISMIIYGVVAIAVWPKIAGTQFNPNPFPVPWTPIWMGPIVSVVSIYLARFLRFSVCSI
jgi:hypothetical protein